MIDWKITPFSECIVRHEVKRQNQINNSEIQAVGRFPVIDQGQSFIAGYTNDEERVIYNGLPYIIFGDHTRCFKFVDFPFVLGADGTKVLKPDEARFDSKFFYFALINQKIPSRGYNRHFKLLKESSVPHPADTWEQKKIASLLTLVQRAIEQQERLIALTTELKKALMHKLFTDGRRGEKQKQTEIGPVPESWKVIPLGSLLKMAQYGLSVKGSAAGSYPMLRMTNQINGQIVPNDLKWVEISEADFNKFSVKRGDVLFNRTNSYDLVGRTAIFDLDGEYAFASYLIRLRVDHDMLDSFFLNHYLNCDETQQRLKSIATRAVSQSNISATRLKSFMIPLPSLEEQDEVISTLNIVDKKIAEHKQFAYALQCLFQTLLHQLMTAQIRVKDLDLTELGYEPIATG